jgi:hypothetical protein
MDVESLVELHTQCLNRLLAAIVAPNFVAAIRRALKVVDHLLTSGDEKKVAKYAGEIKSVLELAREGVPGEDKEVKKED